MKKFSVKSLFLLAFFLVGAVLFSGLTLLTQTNKAYAADAYGLSYTYTGSAYSVSACDKSVTSIVIPASYDDGSHGTQPVSGIDANVFQNFTTLTTVSFGAGSVLGTIGISAFYGCSSLSSIILPNNVTSINNSTFSNCTSLSSITLSANLTTIGTACFSGCSALTSISIPANVATIADSAFDGTTALTSIIVDETNVTYMDDADVALLSKNGQTLFKYAAGNTNASYTIPSTVTTIYSYAFNGAKFTSVTIPSSVTTINSYAFTNSSLTSVTVPSTVTSFGEDVFNGCSGLLTANIEASVTTLPYETFKNCGAMTSVTLSNTITSIGDSAFYSCATLPSITLPTNLTSIGTYAFFRNFALVSITLPSTVATVGDYAFSACIELTSINITSAMTSISASTFQDCAKLATIDIPSTITSIGASAFRNCTELTAITLPNITTIATNTFYNCSKLATINIPTTVTSIGEGAFHNSILSKIYIPSTVTTITATTALNSPFFGNSGLKIYCQVSSAAPAGFGEFWNYGSSVVAHYTYYGCFGVSFDEFITFTGTEPTDLTSQTVVPTLGSLSQDGYSFVGWYYESSYTNVATAGDDLYSKATDSNTVTLYAKWTANDLTFANQTLSPSATCHTSYTSNAFTGASNGTGTYTYEIVSGAPTGITLDSATRIFSGTPTSSPDIYNSIIVKATDSTSGATKNATFTLTLYSLKLSTPSNLSWNTTSQGSAVATWDTVTHATSYTVSLWSIMDETIGSSVEVSTTSYDFGSVITSSSCLNCHFKVYATSTEVGCVASSSASSADLTSYMFSFNSNGGSSVATQYIISGQKATVVNAPTKTNYTFGDWRKGSTTGDTWLPNSFLVTAELTVYATWKYDITFNYNYGDTPETYSHEVLNSVTSISPTTLKTISRTGYTFNGWALSITGTIADVLSTYTDNGTTGDVTIYAVWTLITHTVDYNFNGGEALFGIGQGTYDYGEVFEVEEINDLAKLGYSFGGWNDGTNTYAFNAEYTMGDANVIFTAVWTANTYKVAFDDNTTDTTTGTMADQNFTYDTAQNLTTNTYERENYVFSGWNRNSSGTGTSYSNGANVSNLVATNDYTVTLYAVWEIEQKTITYILANVDGGAVPEAQSFDYNSTATILGNIGNLTKTGHYFVCWNSAGNGSGTNYMTGQEFIITENISLYSVFEANTHTITFDVAGGDALENSTMEIDYAQVISGLPIPTRTGYAFTGWLYGATAIVEGTTVYAIDEDITLTASWEIAYLISFDEVGGEVVEDVYKKATSDLVLPTASKAGYTFAGWQTGETTYLAGDHFTVSTSNVSFTALWTALSYTISFDTNSGTGTFSSIPATSGEAVSQISVVLPERTGYTFDDWYFVGEGGALTLVQNGYVFNFASDITLVAQWDLINYEINYGLNLGSNSINNPATYTIEDEDITLGDATKEGYTFNGWFTTSVFTTGTEIDTIETSTSQDLDIFARFLAISYTITYNLNGGTNSANNPATYTIEDEDITLSDATKAGYTFDSWYADEEVSILADVTIETGSTGDKAFFAVFTIIQYTINYDLDGGTQNAENPTSYNVNSSSFAIFDLEDKTGYTFDGWYSDEDLTTVADVTIETGSTGDLVFYAKWATIEFTISFETNGGLAQEAIVADYNSDLTLPTPTRTGYIFKGWFYDEDLTSSATELTLMPADDVVLYAMWEQEIAESFVLYYAVGGAIALILIVLGIYLMTRPKKNTKDKKVKAILSNKTGGGSETAKSAEKEKANESKDNAMKANEMKPKKETKTNEIKAKEVKGNESIVKKEIKDIEKTAKVKENLNKNEKNKKD